VIQVTAYAESHVCDMVAPSYLPRRGRRPDSVTNQTKLVEQNETRDTDSSPAGEVGGG
jgi:hypothetical protein